MNPTQFDRWQKEFLETGAALFDKADRRTVKGEQRSVSELEAKLKKMDTVVAEIMEDLVAEKCWLGGRRQMYTVLTRWLDIDRH